MRRSPFLVWVLVILFGLVFYSFCMKGAGLCAIKLGNEHRLPDRLPWAFTWQNYVPENRVRTALCAATNSSDPESESIDKAKTAEIMGRNLDEERKTRKFFELVLLPLGVCFMLIMLLRRGFLN